MAQTVKNLPAMWETWVRFLGLEDPLEKGIATHSSILPGEAMDRGTWWATVHGGHSHKELETTELLTLSVALSTFTFVTGAVGRDGGLSSLFKLLKLLQITFQCEQTVLSLDIIYQPENTCINQ